MVYTFESMLKQKLALYITTLHVSKKSSHNYSYLKYTNATMVASMASTESDTPM